MPRSKLTDETVDGIAWQVLAIGSNMVLRATILILLARTLRPVEFGIIAAAVVVTDVAEKFSQIGVSQVLVQRLDLNEDLVSDAFATSAWTGVLATMIVFLSAPMFSVMMRIDALEPYVELLAFSILLNNLAAVPSALLQRDRRFRALGLIGLGSYVFGFGFVALPMAMLGFGAWSLAAAEMAQASSRALVLFIMRCPVMRFWPSLHGLRDLLNVGSSFLAGQIGNFVATQVDYVIVGRWLGAEALGFYNRAYQFLTLPAQLFGAAVSVVLFPSVASIQDQPKRVARVYIRAVGLIAMMTFPVSGALFVLAPEFVRFVLGGQWSAMIVPFQILIVTLLFRTSYKISDAVTLAMGSMVQRAWRQWVYAGAVAVGALLGTRWGIVGVSVGVSVAVVLNFTLMLNLARRDTALAMGPVVRVHARQLAIGVLITTPVWFVTLAARHFQLSDVAILAAGISSAALIGGLLWFRFRSVFGQDGAWLHEIASARLRSVFNR